MQREEIARLFKEFLSRYDEENKSAIWNRHSHAFRDFWNNKILNNSVKEISDPEIDEIIRILDRHGKGNTKGDEAVAYAMIAQGVWRRMFKEIKQHPKLRELLNKIFVETDDNRISVLIDELYKINEGRMNGLTGKSGNAINDMLFVFNPDKYVSIISLNDRRKLIEYFVLPGVPDFDNDTQGKKIVLSNIAIINGFRALGITTRSRTLSCFFYQSPIKDFWRTEEGGEEHDLFRAVEYERQEESDKALFYMESQLEDFLIENWDKSELGKKYDLIEENGELVSQQYKTGIGSIDILAQEKRSKQYVVIELKRDQTSDDTVGQLCRYRGWLRKHKTNGEPVKGIIIAARYDERLDYALQDIDNVEVYLYRVDFKLQEFQA